MESKVIVLRRTYVSQGALLETQAEGRKQRGPCFRFLRRSRKHQIQLFLFLETSLVSVSKIKLPPLLFQIPGVKLIEKVASILDPGPGALHPPFLFAKQHPPPPHVTTSTAAAEGAYRNPRLQYFSVTLQSR